MTARSITVKGMTLGSAPGKKDRVPSENNTRFECEAIGGEYPEFLIELRL